ELGKHWELWQAYRELHCNTQDEGGTTILVNREPRGRKGTTRIVTWGLDEVHLEADKFLIRTEPLWALNGVELHPLWEDEDGVEHGGVFHRGILVHMPNRKM